MAKFSLDDVLVKAGLLSPQYSSEYVAQATAPFINRLPQINPEERDYQQKIIGYKDAYENAQKVYNEAGKILDDANSTQTARSQAERDRTAAQTAMDKAHKNADFVRKVAGNLNYDLSNYDANNTSLDDAKVNLATELQRDFINLRQNDLTPEQVHSRIYNKARDDGLTAGQARRLADQQTQEYQIKREALYNTFINMNARNGGLNNAAMWAINQIAKDSPIMASNYLNGYLTPQAQAQNDFNMARDQNTQANAIAMALLSNQFSNEQDRNRFIYNLLYGRQELENQAALKAIDNEYKTQDRDQRREYDLEDRQYQAKLKQEAEARVKAFEDENTRYLMSAYPGMSESEARLHVRGILKMSKDDKDSKDKEEKLSASEKLLLNGLTILYREARDKPSEENIQAWEKWFNENALKLPPDMHIEARYFTKLFRGLQNKRNGDDNGAAMEWSVIPPTLLEKYLPEYNWDFYRRQWYGEVK